MSALDDTIADLQNAVNNFFGEEVIRIEQHMLNERFYRFPTTLGKNDKDRSGWFIGKEVTFLSYGQYITVLCAYFGDFKGSGDFRERYERVVGEKNHDNGLSSLSSEAKEAYQQSVKEMTARIEQQKREENEKTAGEAVKIWNEVNRNGTKQSLYLKRKGITEQYGTATDANGTLHIPMYDVDSKLWNVQRILPVKTNSNDKFYLHGGRVTGCFYPIGTLDINTKLVFVGEGIATCITVYEATSITTIVAFDAGNLKAVCDALQKKYSNLKIVVAADNDQFTRIKNKPFNTGLKKAKETGRPFILPNFDNIEQNKLLQTKPTDFNDLAQLAGLDVVKTQLRTGLEKIFPTTKQPKNMNATKNDASIHLPVIPSSVPFRMVSSIRTDTPYNYQLEADLIITLANQLTTVKDADLLKKLASTIESSDFFIKEHQQLFAIIANYIKENKQITLNLLKSEVTQELCGYLNSLTNSTPVPASVILDYAVKIKRFALDREWQNLRASPKASPMDSRKYLQRLDEWENSLIQEDNVVYGLGMLLNLPIEKIEYVLPFMPERTTNICHGKTGLGKSMFACEFGIRLALGKPNFFKWKLDEKPRIVGYLDGEMTIHSMQDRMRPQWEHLSGEERELLEKNFKLFMANCSNGAKPSLIKPKGKEIIRRFIRKHQISVLIVDNLMAFSGMEEINSNSEFAEKVKPFTDELNSLGVTVLLVHHQSSKPSKKHSGKGTFLGGTAISALTSTEIILSPLSKPKTGKKEDNDEDDTLLFDGAAFRVSIGKCRHSITTTDRIPFKAHRANGSVSWEYEDEPLKNLPEPNALLTEVFRYLETNGECSLANILKYLGTSPSAPSIGSVKVLLSRTKGHYYQLNDKIYVLGSKTRGFYRVTVDSNDDQTFSTELEDESDGTTMVKIENNQPLSQPQKMDELTEAVKEYSPVIIQEKNGCQLGDLEICLYNELREVDSIPSDAKTQGKIRNSLGTLIKQGFFVYEDGGKVSLPTSANSS